MKRLYKDIMMKAKADAIKKEYNAADELVKDPTKKIGRWIK